MKLTRNQKYLIKMLSEKMPNDSRVINSGEIILGEDLLLCNHTEIKGKPIDPEKEYHMTIPMYFEVNHEKKMAKYAKRKGIEGLVNYMKKYISDLDIIAIRTELQTIWKSKNNLQLS